MADSRESAPSEAQPEAGEAAQGDPALCLDPADVDLRHSERGVLCGEVNGTAYPHLSLIRAFPLSYPEGYLALGAKEGDETREIGMIHSLSELDGRSRAAAERELRIRYLVPLVTRIRAIRQEPAFWRWNILTDRGPAELIMRNIHEHVRSIGPRRLLITDVDGRRFELRDTARLDGRSQALLRRYL